MRAQLLADTGQAAAAQSELDSLMASMPENAPLDTLLTLVEAMNSLRNYNGSLQLLDVAQQLYPREPAPLRLKAETLNFAGRANDSLAIYNQLIGLDPRDSDAILGKARVYNYSNQLPLAETTYRQLLAAQPENYQAVTELADVLGRRGNYAEAIQNYALAIQGQSRRPRDARGTGARAALRRARNRRRSDADAGFGRRSAQRSGVNRARRFARACRAVTRPPSPICRPLCRSRRKTRPPCSVWPKCRATPGNTSRASPVIARFWCATRTTKKRAPSWVRCCRIRATMWRLCANSTRFWCANPTNITARLARADVLGRANRTAEAVRIYNDVLVADPRNVRARSGLADTYVTGRRYADAIRIYDQLIQAEPGNTTYQIARARALGYNRQFVPASDALRRIIAAEPDNLAARLAFAEVGTNSGNAGLRNGAIAEYRRLIAADAANVPARVGLARALSYGGQNRQAVEVLQPVLAAQPNNVPARVALGDAQRFSGQPFDARDTYNAALQVDPNNVGAETGLDAVYRQTRPSVGVSGSYYNDTNGVRLKSLNLGGALRTRGGVIGVIAEQGRFEQGPFETDRSNIGLSYAKAFGQNAVVAAVSRLKYDGAPERFLYDVALTNAATPRQRYFIGTGRRDVYESAQAVVQGITATTYRGGVNVPVGNNIDFEVQGIYYRYSDDNSRYSILPALYYRFRPTAPSLRVGVGYTYDDSDEFRNIYYTPQNFSSFAVLADYQNNIGKTRYGFNAAVPLTSSTGAGNVNRPADTLFGYIARDVGRNIELFANGGIVRSPDFESDQINFGTNVWF